MVGAPLAGGDVRLIPGGSQTFPSGPPRPWLMGPKPLARYKG